MKYLKILFSILVISAVFVCALCIPASAADYDGLIDFKFNEISLSYYTLRTSDGMVLDSTAIDSDKTITIRTDDTILNGVRRYIVFSGALDLPNIPAKSNIQLNFSIQLSSNVVSWQDGSSDTRWVGRTSALNGGSIVKSGTVSFSGNQFITYNIPLSSIESGSYYFGFNIPYQYVAAMPESISITFVNLSITTQDGHTYGANDDANDTLGGLEDIENQVTSDITEGMDNMADLFQSNWTGIMTTNSPIVQGLAACKHIFGIMLNDYGGVWPVLTTIITFAFIIGIWAFLLNVVPNVAGAFSRRFNKK